MLTFSNEDARAIVGKNLGDEASKEVEDLDFLPFPELKEAVSRDVKFLQSSVLERGIEISGWIYQVETGKVQRVV